MGRIIDWWKNRHNHDNPSPAPPVDPNNPDPSPAPAPPAPPAPDHRIGWRIRELISKFGAIKDLFGQGWVAIIVVAILVGLVWYISAHQ